MWERVGKGGKGWDLLLWCADARLAAGAQGGTATSLQQFLNPELLPQCRVPCSPQNWQLLRKGVAINSGANLLSSDTIAPPLDQKYKFASYRPQ